jgi:hypothetical protein
MSITPLKSDTVEMYTLVFSYLGSIPSDLQNSCVYPPQLEVIWGGIHKNFEDPMLPSRDKRTPTSKSVHFHGVMLNIVKKQNYYIVTKL